MAYTRRTCHYCGWRDIQPNMWQKEIEYTSGSSNTGMTARTLFGAIIGEKKASNKFGSWLFAPSKRNYTRRKKVWVCSKCK